MWLRWLGVGLCVLAASVARAEDDNARPRLVLDSGGHTAMVRELLFTPDGRELISVADDKTIRVWDVRTGEPLRVLRPPIGTGPVGKLFAAALSPDGQILAVGGYGAADDEYGGISLISLDTGRLERVLTGHSGTIIALAFSPDGRRLASGSGDDTARIWNVASGECQHTLSGHTSDIDGIAFSPDGRRLATAAYDRTGRIWSVATGKTEAVLEGHDMELSCIAWSLDGRTIATGSDDHSVRLWDSNGRHRRTIDGLGEQFITALSFTSDSRQLLFTQGGGTGATLCGLIDVATGRQTLVFNRHNNTIAAAALAPGSDLAATAGGDDKEIYVWELSDASVVHRLVGAGRSCYSAAWSKDGTRIAWGNSNRAVGANAEDPLERSFDLRRMELGEPPDESFRRATPSRGSVSLKATDDTTVTVERSGRPVATMETTKAYDSVRCFTLLPGDRAAIGANFGLYLYDTRTGEQIREFQGHTGTVWAVSPSPDGRYLLSASADQTLRLWDPERDEPLLSLFFAGNEWIAWTPEGDYACSPGGERLMGWHVNNGKDRMADFHSAARFRKSLYRPHVIKNLLTVGSVELALELAGESKTDIADVLPPNVEITSPAGPRLEAKQESVTVTAKAVSRGGQPVTAMALLLDGRPYQGKLGERRFEEAQLGEVTAEWTVSLSLGKHRLAVQAESAVSTAVSDELEVRYAGSRPQEEEEVRPALYVLAIGVADYDDEVLRLNYAGDDARAVDEAFSRASDRLFRKVETQVLSDKQATRRGIMKGLSWLRKEMTQHDVGVVFFSGHGERDGDGTFYLLPSDVERDDLLTTAVRGETLKDVLRSVPGRVMVLLDACHSGAADAETGDKRKSALTDDLARDLVTDDFGVVVMCSSTGREFSLESSEHRQGYFTVALTEGLAGKADYNGDAAVYLNELDLYVSERVKELTNGRQHPVTAKPASVRSFPLAQDR